MAEETKEEISTEQDDINVSEEIIEGLEIEEASEEETSETDQDIKEETQTEDKKEASEEELSEADQDTKEDTQTQTKEDLKKEEASTDIKDEQDKEEYAVQKKRSKLQNILLIVAGILVFIILVGIVLYFMGFFEPEAKRADSNISKEANATTAVKQVKKKYKFRLDHINTKRLNKKLALLTKYEIIEDQEKELEKIKEKEALKKEIKKEDTASKDKIQDSNISKKEVDANKTIVAAKQDDTNLTIDQNLSKPVTTNNELKKKIIKQTIYKPKDKEFLNFVQISVLRYKLFKSFIDKKKDSKARISICQDNKGRSQILIGPFTTKESRDWVISKINSSIKEDAFAVEFTKEEFDKRCNF